MSTWTRIGVAAVAIALLPGVLAVGGAGAATEPDARAAPLSPVEGEPRPASGPEAASGRTAERRTAVRLRMRAEVFTGYRYRATVTVAKLGARRGKSVRLFVHDGSAWVLYAKQRATGSGRYVFSFSVRRAGPEWFAATVSRRRDVLVSSAVEGTFAWASTPTSDAPFPGYFQQPPPGVAGFGDGHTSMTGWESGSTTCSPGAPFRVMPPSPIADPLAGHVDYYVDYLHAWDGVEWRALGVGPWSWKARYQGGWTRLDTGEATTGIVYDGLAPGYYYAAWQYLFDGEAGRYWDPKRANYLIPGQPTMNYCLAG